MNGTQAARLAGYSEKSAAWVASDLLKHPAVVEIVSAHAAKAQAKLELTVDEVHAKLARIVRFDPRKLYREDGSLKSPTEWDDDTAAAMAGFELGWAPDGRGGGTTFAKKARYADPVAAAQLALKRFGLLRERLEVGLEVSAAQKASDVRDAVRAALGGSEPPAEG
jgi:phage terminase small subunit